MAVHLRLLRGGSKRKPFYRVVAADSRRARNGKFLAIVGTYNPAATDNKCTWKSEKVRYWLERGARPTQTVAQLLKKEPLDLASV